MARRIILSENVPWGAEGVECRLLELCADNKEELDRLVADARKKCWFVWVSPRLRNDSWWGAVMEKGMPDSAHFDEALGLVDEE